MACGNSYTDFSLKKMFVLCVVKYDTVYTFLTLFSYAKGLPRNKIYSRPLAKVPDAWDKYSGMHLNEIRTDVLQELCTEINSYLENFRLVLNIQ